MVARTGPGRAPLCATGGGRGGEAGDGDEARCEGERGEAPPIPIGGGEGFAGNANAVSSRFPAASTGHLYPVSYGSSHIQAVAFKDRGRLAAHTILTYGQSMDPTRPTASDQTRLFSEERCVRFPWTDEQIHRAQVRSYVVTHAG